MRAAMQVVARHTVVEREFSATGGNNILRSRGTIPMIWSARVINRWKIRDRQSWNSTMHVCDEDLGDLLNAQTVLGMKRLKKELTGGALGTVDHWRKVNKGRKTGADILQSDPSFRMSQTSEEQFLDSEGPPPLEVPRKVTNIFKNADT